MKVVTPSGETILLGTVEAAPTIGITDFSRRVTDDFGVTTVVKRNFSRRMSVRLGVPFDRVDALQRRLANLRATSALWVADPAFASLSVRGFYKDFEVDLATPALSYCGLTIEGLAEIEPFTDPGGDPAPDGQASTLRLLHPVMVTDAVLAGSGVPENDYPAWGSGTTYAKGARVIRSGEHRIYESLVAANVGNDPADASGAWLDVGPTNRYAMFDQALGTATTAAGGIGVAFNRAAAGFIFAPGPLPAGATLKRAAGSWSAYQGDTMVIGTAADLPRYDVTGALLVEPAATNLVLKSAELTDAARWMRHGVTAMSAGAPAPDGSISARVTVAGGSFGIYQLVRSPVAEGETVTLSAYHRADAQQQIGVAINGEGQGNNNRGVALDVGTAWARRSYTQVCSGDSGLYALVFGTGGSGLPSLSARTTEIFGVQLERGSTATSYVPSAGTTPATRPAETLTLAWGSRGVADGQTTVRYTFGDGTTQDVVTTVSGGVAVVPTNLNRRSIRGAEIAGSAGPLPSITAVALLDVVGTSVRVQGAGYDRTIAVGSGAIVFADIPAGNGQLSVSVTGSGQVSVGTMLVGTIGGLGITEAAPTAGITDYSRKTVDDFGEVTVVERAWAKRMTARSLISTASIDIVMGRMAAVRAQPSLWIGQSGVDSLTVYGFFKDFSIEVGEQVSKLSLSIEGLSAAAKIEPLKASVDWPDIGDPDGTKPAPNADVTAENTSANTLALGGRPAVDLFARLDAIEAGGGEDTQGAAAARSAAEAARDVTLVARDTATVARDQAQAARDTSQIASTQAEAAAAASAQRAQDASGFAATASGQMQIATQKADAAGQSAITAAAKADIAETKAGEASRAAAGAAASETNAFGSKSSAAESAVVAASARDVTQAARDQAVASATASASGASSAAASRIGAEQAAAASRASETIAGTAAGTASTKATEASVSAQRASEHSNTASTSATLSATNAKAALVIAADALPPTFADGPKFWFPGYAGDTSVPFGAGWSFPVVDGERIARFTRATHPGGDTDIAPIGTIIARAGRRYRATIVHRMAAGGSETVEFYLIGLGAASSNPPYTGDFRLDTFHVPLEAGTPWRTSSYEITGEQILSRSAAGRARLMIRPGTGSGSDRVMDFRRIQLEDITESHAAQRSASAAVESAAAASTKATEAGQSASAATQAKLDAQAASGTAVSKAGVAEQQAAIATDNAAAASRSAGLSAQHATSAGQALASITDASGVFATKLSATAQRASVLEARAPGSGAINLNPYFGVADWTGFEPPHWSIWQGARSQFGISAAAGRYSNNPLNMSRSAGAPVGLTQTLINVPAGWYVFEAEVEMTSGSWRGAGAHVNFNNGSGLVLSFGSTPDLAGLVHDGPAFNRRVWSVLVRNTAQGTANMYAMGGWTDFDGLGAANIASAANFIWHKCEMRPATAGDLKGIDAVARVTQTEIATADLYGRTSSRWKVEAVAGTSTARAQLVADSGGYSAFVLDTNLIVNGDAIFNGSVGLGKLARAQYGCQLRAAWTSGPMSPGAGAKVTLIDAIIGQVGEGGALLLDVSVDAFSNAGTRQVSEHLGKPLYINYIPDGGIGVNIMSGGAQVLSRVFTTSDRATELAQNGSGAFTGRLLVDISRGNYDSGIINDGDYYRRELSATTTIQSISVLAKWTFV